MNSSAEQRLKASGIELPPAPKPLGAYVEAVQVGNLLFVSGALPLQGGIPKFIGRLGGELSIEEGKSAARLAALNALALVRQHLGSLDQVQRVGQLTVTHAVTLPRLLQVVGHVRHRLHAARHDELGVAQRERLGAEDDCL